MLKKKKGKKHIIVNINLKLLYSENNIWSQRYRAWYRYQIRKPRLPNQFYKENRLIDMPDNCPQSFNTFVGKHNTSIFQALQEILEKFEKIKLFPDVLTIYGPSGSGKSAIGKVFVNDLIDIQKYKPAQAEKWCLCLDAKTFKKDLSSFWSKVTTFAEAPMDKLLVTKYRMLVVDNFDSIPPSSQQTLKKIMEAYSNTMKYIFICPDPKTCMTGFVLNKSTNLRTRSINERDALQVVLMICNNHKIGFEREAIKAIFALHPNRSLSKIVDLVQDVFLKLFYVSRENVMKFTIGKATDTSDLPVFTQHRAVEPYERCELCTLVPPCQHVSIEELIRRGVARRKELPRYKTGSMACPGFVRYGYCAVFNKTGRCSLDHPKNLHVIKKFAVRCPQCSIVWPCNHCDFTKYRVSMQALIDELHTRIGRIRSINVPEPPISLIRHLEHITAWREQLRHIGRKYMTPEYAAIITAATEWLDTGYCTKKDEYRKREKALREAFGEMYTTHILDDPAVAQNRGRVPSAGQGAANKQAASAPRPNSPQSGVAGEFKDLLKARSGSPTTSPTQSQKASPQVLSRKIM